MVVRARLMPTGTCWCGCGKVTAVGAYFKPGHDKIADAHVIEMKYGAVPDFLVHHGFGGRPGDLNLDKTYKSWRERQEAASHADVVNSVS
jgi:hypothetical protein